MRDDILEGVMGPGSDPPIVGIGASAGGVQALQSFFEALPDEPNAAFVVVVHLAPEFRSQLASILASRTAMPVAQVELSAKLENNHVYVIAPNSRLVVADHTISAFPFDEPRSQRAPIDLFFRSLAERHTDGFAYAIVLTGAGADGTIGVKCIKEAGGIVLVQDPNEAEYPSMPRSAIAADVADFVLPLRDLAEQLVELLKNGKGEPSPAAGLDNDDEGMLRRILAHLRVRIGHDFSLYKRATILRRIARRVQVTRTESLEAYYEFLRDNADEAHSLFTDFLISVTTFFRDREAFDTLAQLVVPRLFEGKEAGDVLRVWVPGCATGEEAYSIGILLLEQATERDFAPEIQVFGSDLDPSALAVAREGRFPATIEADVSEERLRRFFQREGDHYRVRRQLRDIVLFASHSLLRDPPFSRLDLISCRNLLIYLDRDLQYQVCNTFHYALNPGGFLFLGASESADERGGLFRSVDRDARIYRSAISEVPRPALPILPGPSRLPVETSAASRPAWAGTSMGDAALHRQMLEKIAPPSMLVDQNYRAVHLSDNAGRFIQPSGGPITADATEMVREELRFDLRAALHRAFERGEATLSMPLSVQFNGAPHRVYLQVKPVAQGHDTAHFALVIFIEGEAVEHGAPEGIANWNNGGSAGEAIRQLQEELQLAHNRVRATREESDAANEELRAANEELQSINEEYRSTSEELETSKEELQSINEELQTVNNELKIKLENVSQSHSDLQNLMAAADFGILFLDPSLRIKRFTPRLTDLFNITISDEGVRSLTLPTSSITAGWLTTPAPFSRTWCRFSMRSRAKKGVGT
jgi:two-component system CheB/CheR fusion protein